MATVINGTVANDRIQGTTDDDIFVASGGNDTIAGNGGDDMVDYSELSGPISVTFTGELSGTVNKGAPDTDTFVDIHHVYGTSTGDLLRASAATSTYVHLRGLA